MKQDFLVLRHITKCFDKNTVIDDLNFSIPQGSMVTLLGPSGCGKTTVLRLIAGLESPNSGQIFIDGVDVTHQSTQQRGIGIVFQSYALFPHLSIGDNVAYGLKMQGVSAHERLQRVREVLDLVDLSGFEERFIDQLSGGQQQRVALARALILKPKVLLFDEPLSNLDANLRRLMRTKIRELQQKLGITSLYVTHDQAEAFALSDQVIVMDKGVIKQQDTAHNLYLYPRSRFLAHFMGEATLFKGLRQGETIHIGDIQFNLNQIERFNVPEGNCLVGIRPESIQLQPNGNEYQRCIITQSTYMGAYWEIRVAWQGYDVLLHLSPEQYIPAQTMHYLHFNRTGMFLLCAEESHICEE